MAHQGANWICRLGDDLPKSVKAADLWIVEPKPDGGLAWRRIGFCREGHATLTEVNPAAHLAEGRPIFAGEHPGD
jgi:hypothetical protein